MRGDPRTVSVRSPVITPSRRWFLWITRPARRPRRSKQEKLELIERLRSEERRRLRSGEQVPDLSMLWRWR
jgi:hypothetical protein